MAFDRDQHRAPDGYGDPAYCHGREFMLPDVQHDANYDKPEGWLCKSCHEKMERKLQGFMDDPWGSPGPTAPFDRDS